MKTITLQVIYPFSIHAIDSDGQWMNITRRKVDKISDGDTCRVVSGHNDPHDPRDIQHGTVKWGEAFREIADFMNCTQLD